MCKGCDELLAWLRNDLDRHDFFKPEEWSSACDGYKAFFSWLGLGHRRTEFMPRDPQIWTLGLRKDESDFGFGITVPGSSMRSRLGWTVFHDLIAPGRARSLNVTTLEVGIAKRWIESCDSHHGPTCNRDLLRGSLFSDGPTWLVDCEHQRLVPAPRGCTYVALSYVWGSVQFFRTRRADLALLQQDGSLSRSTIRSKPNQSEPIAPLIRDVIKLVIALGEKYLWVDALCIVQDDTAQKHAEILNMASIYANASFTIVDLNGNTTHGLKGISVPRNGSQNVFQLPGNQKVVRYSLHPNRRMVHKPSEWDRRAWTFQEKMFSRRLLYISDIMLWECNSRRAIEESERAILPNRIAFTRKFEDIGAMLRSGLPDLGSLWGLLGEYNQRQFSYEDDAFNAIASSLLAMSCVFKGGFISGLPVLFFDAALLWLPGRSVKRRLACPPSTAGTQDASLSPVSLFPSWSWIGWDCSICPESAVHAYHFLYQTGDFMQTFDSLSTESLVQWYFHKTVTSSRQPIPKELQLCQDKYLVAKESMPPGWERVEAKDRPDPYFTHGSAPRTRFKYPIPLESSPEISIPFLMPFLSCRTRRALISGNIWDSFSNGKLSHVNEDGFKSWIHANVLSEVKEGSSEHSELVEISKSWSDVRLYDNRLVRVGSYHYNVLWIEWINGIAYRKGVGEIEEKLWECQDLEWIDLTLG